MKTADVDGIPAAFLKAFRRRSLLVAALRLAFFAALVNEGVRWLAVAAGNWLEMPVAVISSGLFFWVAACLFTLRRWSLESTALSVDRALNFQDRFTSLVDFSRRSDISKEIVLAQAAEVGSALGPLSLKKIRPIPVLAFAGPLLLLFSVFYPNLMRGMPARYSVERYLTGDYRHPPPGSKRETGSGGAPSSVAESDGTGIADPLPPEDEPDVPGDSSSEGEALNTAGDEGSPTGKGGAFSDLGTEEEGETDAVRQVHRAGSGERKEPLKSERVGKRLSRVVDPLFLKPTPGEDEKKGVPGGSVSFSIVPKTGAGEGAPGKNVFAESSPGSIIVDFDDIPEQYREVVEKYFVLLGNEEISGGQSE